MTPLGRLLAARIAADGPMDLADYMAECLLHPAHGYYATRDPFGAAGDFVTAPEISQMFGEMIGACLAAWWQSAGAPAPVRLVELGPGRGTLMADILRTAARVPGLAPEVHLVEASPTLRAAQARAVPGARHHDRLEDVPPGATLLVANEFVDALPIRAHLRDGANWRARVVGQEGGALRLGHGPAAPLPALGHRLEDTADGDVVESRPAADAVMRAVEDRLTEAPGIALVIDYGDWRSLGDTLQAVRAHAPEDPLARPGEADLTAHVDFEALAAAAPALAHTLLTPQGVFLERLGITARARALAAGLRGAALDAHVAAHRRLVHPDEMGRLFKAIAFVSPGLPAPPGLHFPREGRHPAAP